MGYTGQTASLAAILMAALAAPPFAAPAQAATSKNLLLNGTGAAATCTNDWVAVTTVPGWTVAQGDPAVNCSTIAQMNTPEGKPIPAAFIADGPWGDSALTQTVDLSSAATAIDAGGVNFHLSGWLGGWAEYTGQAVVTITFLSASGQPLGTPATLSGVTAAARKNESGFQARSADGAVPAGARSANVLLQFIDSSATFDDGYATNLSLTLSTPVTTPVLVPPPAAVPQFDHVFLIMMENTNYGQVIGDTKDAPFINGLASQGALLANYTGVYHPSDENYLAIAGGNTFVEGAIYFPNIAVTSPNLGDELEAQGKNWRAYEQGMGEPCNLNNNFDTYYEPDDAPFINFTDVADNLRRCQDHLVDTKQLPLDLRSASTTPAFSWIAADDYYDGESSGNGSPKSLRVQDNWLRRTLAPVFASPAWTQQRSLLVLTWDESSTYANNHIATILVGSQGLVQSGVVSNVAYNHYSTGRTVEAALGLAPFTANDGYAPTINDAFTAGAALQPTLYLSSGSVAEGQNITATYTTPPASLSSTNWVGLYKAGQTPGQTASTTYQYAPNSSGTLTFPTTGIAPGNYGMFYLYNNGYTVLAGPDNFTISSAAAYRAAQLQASRVACPNPSDPRLTAPQTSAQGRGRFRAEPQCR